MKLVWCAFRIVGYHNFLDAPEEVAYLRVTHRHDFHFKVSVEVSHENREVEFHMLKRFCIESLFSRFPISNDELSFGGMSCEMIGELLMRLIISEDIYNSMPEDSRRARQIIIDVSEDGECGGIVTRL